MTRATLLRLLLVAMGGLTGCWPSFDGLTDGTVDGKSDGAPRKTERTDGATDSTSGATDSTNESCVVEQNAKQSKNCGRCGRDCELGECVDGDCAPFLLVTDQQPVQLAVADTYLYWTNGGMAGSVRRILQSGTGPAKVLATGQQNPGGLVVSGDHIYWVDQGATDAIVVGKYLGPDGALMTAALDGTVPRLLSGGFRRPMFLLIDTGRIYIAEHGVNELHQPSDGAVTSCSIPDCADRRTLVDPAVFPMQLALGAGSLFWTTDVGDADAQAGSIWQIPIAGSQAASRVFGLTKLQSYRLALSSDASTVYYTSKNFRSISRHPPGLVTNLNINFEPHAIVVDSTYLFAINGQDSTVPGDSGSFMRVGNNELREDGKEPTSLKKYAVERGGDAIVDAGNAIFFTTATSIMKVVK